MMFPKPKKRKKPTKKYLKKKADTLFSKRIRSVNTCEIEGKDNITCNGDLQCMHIVGRSNHKLRWDSNNALCGCQGHHMYYTNHPWEWNELIKQFYPVNYEYLNVKRLERWDKDIEKVIKELESEVI